MKTIRKKLESFCHSYPATAVIVCVKQGATLNAMAVAWHMPVSFKPPLYAVSISPKRFTHAMIVKAKEFSINFLTHADAEFIHKLGHTSGKTLNKFKKYGIKTEKPARIKSPVLKKAFAAYECRLFDFTSAGDHTIFIGEVIAIHSDDASFTVDGLIRLDRTRPAMYIGDDHYVTADSKSLVSTKDTKTD